MGMFAVVLFLSQYILTMCLLQIDNSHLQSYLLRFDMYLRLQHYLKLNTDILFFGDSTLYDFKPQDEDKRSIPELLQALTPGYSLAELSHASYHMDIYLEYCNYIAKQKNRPKLIIIPINMRSFSPEWDMRPQYQFEREKTILRNGPKKYLLLAFDRLLLSLRYNFFSISHEEFLHEPVFSGNEKVGVVKDFINPDYNQYSYKNVRNKFIFFYMYSLRRGHRKVKSLLEIARVLSRNHIPVIFYITPIDCQTGEKFFPRLFSRRLAENVEVIRSALAEEGSAIMDFSTALPRDAFTWHRYPNEHIGNKGKIVVAERLLIRVNKLLKK
jgi:hypothetical protein